MEAARSPLILQSGEGRAMRTHVDRVLKADARLTDGRFSIAEATHVDGFATRPHRHQRHDEMFYVLAGEYTFQVGGVETSLGPGGFVFIPAGSTHAFKCKARGTMLIMFSPGDGEDYFAELANLYENGENDPKSIAALQAKHGMEAAELPEEGRLT